MAEPSLSVFDISKIGDLFKIMKEPDSEQKFINYLENNKSLLKAKSSILPGEGNIFHMLAMGEKTQQNPEVGCITLPWLYSGYKGYIDNFANYLHNHPNVMNYIRENIPDALVAKSNNKNKNTPIDFAIHCKNQVMIDVLRQNGGKIKTQQKKRKTQKKRRKTRQHQKRKRRNTQKRRRN